MPKTSDLTADELEYLQACEDCVKLREKSIPQQFPKGRSTIRITTAWTDIAAYGIVKLQARCVADAGRTYVDVNWMDWRPRMFLLDLTREGPGMGVWEGVQWCLEVVSDDQTNDNEPEDG